MKNSKGFTLIEMLVIIAIIGALIILMVPNLAGIKDRPKEVGVKAVMHSVQLAIEAYNMENYTYPIATNVTLKDLQENYLSAGGYLATIPKNPFTNQPYAATDTAGKIIYTCDSSADQYTLTGYRRNGVTKLLELKNM